MKFPALRAAVRSPSWATFASLSATCALCFGCESNGAAATARPAASVKVHPAFAVPKTPEMLPDVDSAALRVEDPAPAKPAQSRDKKDWQANCKIQRPCVPEAKSLPTCEANVTQRPWVDVVTEGNAVAGKEVEVSGTVGLSLVKKTGGGECAPGACCHTLDMQLVLIGEPNGSLPLKGLTCSGDDSTLCCSVPADGQAVVARGKLKKITAGLSQWQLIDPTLCVIDNTRHH
jgi:hypothetical protein